MLKLQTFMINIMYKFHVLNLYIKRLPAKLSILCLLTLLSIPTQVQSGSWYIESFFSPQLDRDWCYKVYLPAEYDSHGTSTYPVIYLLHGSAGDENSWDFIYPKIDSLISNEIIPALICISPSSGTSWWVDTAADKFESAFIQNLIPEIDKKFRTIKDRSGRGIAGFSMGGYGALRYSLQYPEYFGTGMVLSPALYQDLPPQGSSARSSGAFGMPFDENLWNSRNYPGHLQNYFEKNIFVPIFIATGDDDWHHDEDFTYNIEQQAVYLYGKLHKEGNSPAELRVVDGGHTEQVWTHAFIEGLQYMFRYLAQPK